MQFNVSQLLQEPIGSTRTYELAEDIQNLDPELGTLGPLVGKIQILRTHSGALVTGTLSTAVRVDCNRCLAPIVVPVRFSVEENYRPLTEVQTGRYIHPQDYEGSEEELEDAALLIDEHHILDISEVVRQNIWLALPLAPQCNWEGPGECPNLIEHLQGLEGLVRAAGIESEDEPEEPVDPRWAALLELRGQLDDPDNE